MEYGDPVWSKEGDGRSIRDCCANHPGYAKYGSTRAAYETHRVAIADCPHFWPAGKAAATPLQPLAPNSDGGNEADDAGVEDFGDDVGDPGIGAEGGKAARIRRCARIARERKSSGEHTGYGKGIS